MDERSGESKEEKVMGEWIRESEMEERVPEWGWQSDKDGSKDKVKHNERNSQLFLEMMM